MKKSTSVEATEEEGGGNGGNKEVYQSTSVEAAEEGGGNKEVCICSPTTHPGSFKCRLHRAPPPSNPKEPPKTKAKRNVGLSRFSNDVSQGNN